LVWCPRYNKKLFGQEYLCKRAKELFREIAEEYEFIIEESEVAADHVQILGIFSSKVFNHYRAKDPEKY
jgi:REP element-mobilizing transposase RayT